jgi:Domain of unknown function (DUF4388)
MTDFSGTLEGVGLPAILRFLTGLKKTGCLRVTHGDWHGEIFFEDGRVIGASLGSRVGLAALDALVQALPTGAFEFDASWRPESGPTIQMSQQVFEAHLNELELHGAQTSPRLPPVDAVPTLVAEQDLANTDEPVSLDRGTLQTLLAVDGQRTVRAIVTQRGSFDALWQLAQLIDVGLVRLAATAREGSAPAGREDDAAVVRPFAPAETQPSHPSPGFCPKLGFEDDPSTSFGRPTRLHRCFAAGRPLPLSMDQQRELCLNEQFATCPRLTSAGAVSPPSQVAAQAADAAPAGPEDGRVVRWPHAGRARMAGRASATPVERTSGSELSTGAADRARVRAVAAGSRDGAAGRPTPLRARMERPPAAPSTTAVLEPPSAPPLAPTGEVSQHEPAPAREVAHEAPRVRRFGSVPPAVVAGAAVVIVVLAAVGYLLAPRLGPMLADDTLDPARLPNTSAVAAGTPVAQVASPRLTAESGEAAQSAPEVSPTRARGTPVAAVSQPATQAQPSAGPATLLDERFTSAATTWPNDPQGTAWLSDGIYQIATRRAGEFVAISAPVADVPPNVIVSATLHKLGGPAGGGYGIVVRDQGAAAQDGVSQAGRYYVLEVGDKGEVGIWRRETDHWVDLQPWQRSDAVKPGNASNELTVRAIGNTLSLIVNGVEVATRTDAAYAGGRIGLFVGGDGNQVALDHFVVQTP